MHTSIHMYTCAYITYINAGIYTYVHMYMYTYINAYIHTYVHMYMYAYINADIYTYVLIVIQVSILY